MRNIEIDVKRVRDGSLLPFYATAGSAGMDLIADLSEPMTLIPGEIRKVPSGISISIENPHIGGFIYPRSGLSSKYGISLANCVGVIDSDYTGEILVPLINHSTENYTVQPGDRIAQLVFQPVYRVSLREVEKLDETERGEGGFGSSGK